jgi:hypothetical protein
MKIVFIRLSATFATVILSVLLFNRCNYNNNIGNYRGTPFADSVFKGGAQIIPGKLQCEY